MKPQGWFWFSFVGFPLQPAEVVRDNEGQITTDTALKVAVPTETKRREFAALQQQHGFDLMDCALWRFVNRGEHFEGLNSFWGKFISDLDIYLALADEEYWHRLRTGEKSKTWDGRTVLVSLDWRTTEAARHGRRLEHDYAKQKEFGKNDHRTYRLVPEEQ
jgi:hypothetical protein